MQTLSIAEFVLRLGVGVGCGALIGIERQWQARRAGLRTNALVSIGAAGFVIFSTTLSSDSSPTQVAAQIVSGIGFLGAGVILREGINVRGLNTAATLWCSAMVGTFAGAGELIASAIAGAFRHKPVAATDRATRKPTAARRGRDRNPLLCRVALPGSGRSPHPCATSSGGR